MLRNYASLFTDDAKFDLDRGAAGTVSIGFAAVGAAPALLNLAQCVVRLQLLQQKPPTEHEMSAL